MTASSVLLNGPDGVAVSPTNGGGPGTLSSVTNASGATLAYDADVLGPDGGNMVKCSPATGATAYVSVTGLAAAALRVRVEFTIDDALPTENEPKIRFRNPANGTQGRVVLQPSGKLLLQHGANVNGPEFTTVLPPGTYQVESLFTGSTSSASHVCTLYDATGSQIEQITDSAISGLASAVVDGFDVGFAGSPAVGTPSYHFGRLAWSDDAATPIGPYVVDSPPSTGYRPLRYGINWVGDISGTPDARLGAETLAANWGVKWSDGHFYNDSINDLIPADAKTVHAAGTAICLGVRLHNAGGAPIPYPTFTGGSNDSDVEALADDFCSLDFTGENARYAAVIFQWEPNASTAKKSGSDAGFVAAFAHFWSVFAARCIANGKPASFVGNTILRVWNPTSDGFRVGSAGPGKRDVDTLEPAAYDIIGGDAYGFWDKTNTDGTTGVTFNAAQWPPAGNHLWQRAEQVTNWAEEKGRIQPIWYPEINCQEYISIPASGGTRPFWNHAGLPKKAGVPTAKADEIRLLHQWAKSIPQIERIMIFDSSNVNGRETQRIDPVRWPQTAAAWQSVVTDDVVPVAPTLSATDTTVTVTWPEISGAAGYEVAQAADDPDDPGVPGTWSTVDTPTSAMTTADGLTPETVYWFRYREAAGTWSDPASITTAATPTDPPTGLTLLIAPADGSADADTELSTDNQAIAITVTATGADAVSVNPGDGTGNLISFDPEDLQPYTYSYDAVSEPTTYILTARAANAGGSIVATAQLTLQPGDAPPDVTPTMVTVAVTIDDGTTGAPVTDGQVTVTPDGWRTNTADNTLLAPRTLRYPIAAGQVQFDVFASDDPRLEPQGVGYTIKIEAGGQTLPDQHILPSIDDPTLELAAYPGLVLPSNSVQVTDSAATTTLAKLVQALAGFVNPDDDSEPVTARFLTRLGRGGLKIWGSSEQGVLRSLLKGVDYRGAPIFDFRNAGGGYITDNWMTAYQSAVQPGLKPGQLIDVYGFVQQNGLVTYSFPGIPGNRLPWDMAIHEHYQGDREITVGDFGGWQGIASTCLVTPAEIDHFTSPTGYRGALLITSTTDNPTCAYATPGGVFGFPIEPETEYTAAINLTQGAAEDDPEAQVYFGWYDVDGGHLGDSAAGDMVTVPEPGSYITPYVTQTSPADAVFAQIADSATMERGDVIKQCGAALRQGTDHSFAPSFVGNLDGHGGLSGGARVGDLWLPQLDGPIYRCTTGGRPHEQVWAAITS